MTVLTTRASGIFATAVLAFAALCAAPASADPRSGEADFDKLAAEKSDALVSVKFVLRMKGGSGDNENEGEVTAVMIDPAGVLVTSNSQVGGNPAFMRRGAAPTLTDIKVFFGNDDAQGLEARMVARDSELDLVWFKIKQPGERKFAFIDLAKSTMPKVGDRIYTIVRLGKYFDRMPVVREGRVGALAKKPRALVVPSVNLGALGQPIFTADGVVIGLSVVQLPDAEEIAAASSPAAFSGANSMILPAAEVAKATKRALDADTGEDGDATSKPADENKSTGESKNDKAGKEEKPAESKDKTKD